MESKILTKKKGGTEASLMVYYENDKLSSVCCGVINVDGDTKGSVIMDDYGLSHTYNGNGKDNADSAVKSLENALAKEFNLTFQERPVESEMQIPEQETNEQEQ